MANDPELNKKAILLAVDTGSYDTESSLLELHSLCKSAGCIPVAELVQKREFPDPLTYLGKGKIEEAKAAVQNLGIELAVTDGEITSSQQKGIEEILGIPVLDRTTVILDIFATGAVTKEGAIQVELAQLQYRLPRLTGMGVSLSRLGGGIGTRGPGETKLETDRRHIMRRIRALKLELKKIEEHRNRLIARRSKNGVPVIALAGYTNAGKSTLLNRLCGSDVKTEDRLFATLDPAARELRLPDGTGAVCIDTVGFIQRIPHHLIEAFRSTLSHLKDADIILNVCDATSPDLDVHNRVTLDMLRELGCEGASVITVLNKWDKTGDSEPSVFRDTVVVSAKTGLGIDDLKAAIVAKLGHKTVTLEILVPFAEVGRLARLRQRGMVLSEHYEEEGICARVRGSAELLNDFKEFIQPKKE